MTLTISVNLTRLSTVMEQLTYHMTFHTIAKYPSVRVGRLNWKTVNIIKLQRSVLTWNLLAIDINDPCEQLMPITHFLKLHSYRKSRSLPF